MRGARRGVVVAALFALGYGRPVADLAAQTGRAVISPDPAAPPAPLPRLSGPIRLDGIVNEPAWDAIEPLPLTMWAPVFGGEMTERTEVRVAYDDRYLYLSGRLFDSDPLQIRSNTFYRDRFSGDDLLAIVVDSYNDYETAVWFVTNPAGARTDRTMSNDAEVTGQGMPMNTDWNSHWDVATHRDGEGWSAEFRIPFSTLGFQTRDGEAEMGIIVYRYIGRKNERHLFPAISQEWGSFGFAKPSQARRVVLKGVHPTRPVYVTPYLLGGLNQRPILETAPVPAWHTEQDPTTEFGADLRYSPSSNLSLDLTANTDFAQVEADDEQINLTRFPLFFPEKRQFFQERASTFEFGTGGFTDRLFFSRRIGLDDGELVRIYGGARLVGRTGGLDFGVLSMQTAPHAGRSGENMSVVRLNQQVFNPYSSVGGMVTARLGENGEDNVAYGIDADVRVFGDEYLTVKWARTFDEAIEEGNELDAGIVRARWARRRDEGLSYWGEFARVGPDYLPRLGFQLRQDFRFFGGRLRYQWFPGAPSPFRAISISGTTEHYYRNADGTAESRILEPQLRFEFRDAGSITLGVRSSFEGVRDTFAIAEVPIPPGEYWFHEAQANLELSRNSLFRGTVRASAGSFYDGSRLAVALSPTWNASRYLEMSGGYELNRLEFEDRNRSATTHLARLRLQVALDTHVSLSTFAQYNSLSDQTSVNARFRYHFREGTDLWLVYTEGFNVERDNGPDPRLPLSAGRALMVKYSHTFAW